MKTNSKLISELVAIEIAKAMAYAGHPYDEILLEIEKTEEAFPVQGAKEKIHDYITDYQLAQQEKTKALNQLIIGLILLVLGIGFTTYTFFANQSSFILAWGAILAGACYALSGYHVYRKPIEELVPRINLLHLRRNHQN